jgi:4-aminobutyrate aminotransferase-like enzyme
MCASAKSASTQHATNAQGGILQEDFSLPWEPQVLHLTGLMFQIFRMKPPMCITKEDVDFAVSVLETAISKQQMTWSIFSTW